MTAEETVPELVVGRFLSLSRSTYGRLLPARLCRLACPRTGRKKGGS